jgi:hypothetical protein
MQKTVIACCVGALFVAGTAVAATHTLGDKVGIAGEGSALTVNTQTQKVTDKSQLIGGWWHYTDLVTAETDLNHAGTTSDLTVDLTNNTQVDEIVGGNYIKQPKGLTDKTHEATIGDTKLTVKAVKTEYIVAGSKANNTGKGSIVNGNTTLVIEDGIIQYEADPSKGAVVGGNYIKASSPSAGMVSQTNSTVGDTSVTINGGTFGGSVYGSSFAENYAHVDTPDMQLKLTTGNSSLQINGGTYNGHVVAGSGVTGQGTSSTAQSAAITINAAKNKTVTLGNNSILIGGDYLANRGKSEIEGNTSVTVTGEGTITLGKGIVGGSYVAENMRGNAAASGGKYTASEIKGTTNILVDAANVTVKDEVIGGTYLRQTVKDTDKDSFVSATVGSTNLILKAGTFKSNVIAGGKSNDYTGSLSSDVLGDTSLNITGGTYEAAVLGGGSAKAGQGDASNKRDVSADVMGTARVNVTGGTLNGIVGGGLSYLYTSSALTDAVVTTHVENVVDHRVVASLAQAHFAAQRKGTVGEILLVHEAVAVAVHDEAAVDRKAERIVGSHDGLALPGALAIGAAELVAAERPVAVGDAARLDHHPVARAVRKRIAERHDVDVAEVLANHVVVARVAARRNQNGLCVITDPGAVPAVSDEHARDGFARLQQPDGLALGLEDAAHGLELRDERTEAIDAAQLLALLVREVVAGAETHAVGVAPESHVHAVVHEGRNDALALRDALSQQGGIHRAATEAVLALEKRFYRNRCAFGSLNARFRKSGTARLTAVAHAAARALLKKMRLYTRGLQHERRLDARRAAAEHDGIGLHDRRRHHLVEINVVLLRAVDVHLHRHRGARGLAHAVCERSPHGVRRHGRARDAVDRTVLGFEHALCHQSADVGANALRFTRDVDHDVHDAVPAEGGRHGHVAADARSLGRVDARLVDERPLLRGGRAARAESDCTCSRNRLQKSAPIDTAALFHVHVLLLWSPVRGPLNARARIMHESLPQSAASCCRPADTRERHAERTPAGSPAEMQGVGCFEKTVYSQCMTA